MPYHEANRWGTISYLCKGAAAPSRKSGSKSLLPAFVRSRLFASQLVRIRTKIPSIKMRLRLFARPERATAIARGHLLPNFASILHHHAGLNCDLGNTLHKLAISRETDRPTSLMCLVASVGEIAWKRSLPKTVDKASTRLSASFALFGPERSVLSGIKAHPPILAHE